MTPLGSRGPRIVHVDDVPWQEVRRQQHGPDPARTASVYERWLDTQGGFLALYARWDPGMTVQPHGHNSDHVVFGWAGVVVVDELGGLGPSGMEDKELRDGTGGIALLAHRENGNGVPPGRPSVPALAHGATGSASGRWRSPSSNPAPRRTRSRSG